MGMRGHAWACVAGPAMYATEKRENYNTHSHAGKSPPKGLKIYTPFTNASKTIKKKRKKSTTAPVYICERNIKISAAL